MAFARPSTLVLAAVVDSPALWHAFVLHDLSPTDALLRYLVAVPVCALMLMGLRAVTSAYQPPRAGLEALQAGPPVPRRRRTDPPDPE